MQVFKILYQKQAQLRTGLQQITKIYANRNISTIRFFSFFSIASKKASLKKRRRNTILFQEAFKLKEYFMYI